MFEKEAEEYAKETFVEKVRPTARNAFKDGAEFGYNKANEWHYEGNPDITHKSCLVYCEKLPHLRIAYWNGQEWVENTILRFPEVKAWRYADYPKESEFKSNILPEITLPEGSAEHIDKIIADAEKRLKEIE